MDQLLERVVVAEPALRHQVEEARFSLPGAAREKRSKRFSRIAVSPLEIIDLCKPQRHQLGIRIAFRVRFETKKTGAGIRVTAAAEQALPPAHFQLVARVAGRELLHLRQRLQRTFCLGSMLAEWKFVIQVQVGRRCALRIAVSERGIRKAQPDGRDIDRCFVENVFVDFGGVPEITFSVGRLRLAQRRGLAHEPWRLLQFRKSPACGVEPAEPQFRDAGVVRSVGTQRRGRRGRS